MQTSANKRRMKSILALTLLLMCTLIVRQTGRGTLWRAPTRIVQAAGQSADPRLKPAYRFEKGGWIYVHLEGTPG